MNSPYDQQQQHPRQPTTSFVLFRTHQAGLVARNRCCDFNKAGFSTNALKRPFVGKVRKRTKPVVGCLGCCCRWSCSEVHCLLLMALNISTLLVMAEINTGLFTLRNVTFFCFYFYTYF